MKTTRTEALFQAEYYESSAYVRNARHELAELRSTVNDILTGANDVYAKTSMLTIIDAADENLRKALL
jgi:hypothetical protein